MNSPFELLQKAADDFERMRIRIFPLLSLLLILFAEPPQSMAVEPRRNILFILADDLGFGDVSCYGGANVPTPHLDRLAEQGIRFTQFTVAAPICSASRAGYLTGRFPARCRITSYLQTKAGNRACEQDDFLDPRTPNFVRSCKEAGYAAAHVGKWHLGGGRDVTEAPPFSAYGYDRGWGTFESPEPAAELGLKSTPWGKELEPQQVPRHERTRWMVDRTIAFIEEQRERSWLVNLWLDDVHTPFRPAPDQLDRAANGSGSAEFRAVLTETDRHIGRLLARLDELNLAERTIVIFAGDNGPEPTFDRNRTNGLRGMKWSLYEGGLRTPLIVRTPGLIPAGKINRKTVINAVDLYPTLATLLKLDPPKQCDGEDLSAAWLGEETVRSKTLYWEYGRIPFDPAAKGPRFFQAPNEPNSRSPNLAVREGDWKLLIGSDGTGAELYDLASDPREERNLAEKHPELATRLSRRLLDWRKNLP